MSQEKRETTRSDYSSKIRDRQLAKRELSEAQLEALAGGGFPVIN